MSKPGHGRRQSPGTNKHDESHRHELAAPVRGELATEDTGDAELFFVLSGNKSSSVFSVSSVANLPWVGL